MLVSFKENFLTYKTKKKSKIIKENNFIGIKHKFLLNSVILQDFSISLRELKLLRLQIFNIAHEKTFKLNFWEVLLALNKVYFNLKLEFAIVPSNLKNVNQSKK